MTLKPINLLLLCLAYGGISLHAQEKCPVKFGKVVPSDFVLTAAVPDSSANAIVIADVGNSEFEGNTKGWFSLVFKHTKRIKILNKNGFDAANVSIHLYSSGNAEEKLEKLRAVTYNLEGGKVVETKLDDKSIFKDVLSKHWVEKKFTFPAVKEGSIIEYTYTVSSDYLRNLRSWEFQGEYPCLWSEYEVAIPFFFNYVFLSQGYNAMYINTKKSSFKSWNVTDPGEGAAARSETTTLSGDVTYNRWVMKDVKPLKEEKFTSTLDNHTSKIEFQLSQFRFPNMPVKEIMENWTKVNEDMMKDEDFGANLGRNNNWMDDQIKAVTGQDTDIMAKVNHVYAYVRDNFTCTNYNGIYLTSTLKNVMKARNGSVSDLNLLLCAMLKHENVTVNPVILSTRNHGYTHQFYPLMDRFNYVICEVNVNDHLFYLDASRPNLGFGKLPVQCYNGHARVLGETCRPVYFEPDSLIEKKVTTVFIINGEKEGLAGNYNSTDGDFESLGIRQKLKDKGEAGFFKEITAGFDGGLDINNPGIDSIKILEQPVNVHYDFNMKVEDDVYYFNPLMKDGYHENLFKAADRQYPVEMPFAFDEMYVFNMEIPKGYEVEEIPKSTKVAFNDKEGYFEYLIQKDNDRIQLRSRVIMRKTLFMPSEYQSLRDFFGLIVKKHGEQIVFKKKKA